LRVKSAALTAAGLVILDEVVIGDYGIILATEITAGHINLTTGFRIEGETQATVGVWIDATDGITIRGGKLYLKSANGLYGREIYVDEMVEGGYLRLGTVTGNEMLSCLPDETNTRFCGTAGLSWGYGYIDELHVKSKLFLPAVP
ncbi:unnamed protein product, partial [marine sediment metagenome]